MQHWTTEWFYIFGALGIIAVLLVIWARHTVRTNPLFPLQHEAHDFEMKKEYYQTLTNDNERNNNHN